MSININIKTTNLDLTPEISNYVHEKIGMLEKFIQLNGDEEVLAEVEIGIRSRHHKKGDVYRAEVNLTFKGNIYRAVSKEASIFAAIDNVRDQIERVVRRGKNKKAKLFRRGALRAKELLKGLRKK